ncbi:helix-turn-helix domain-containing protein [Parapedobacter sp. 2B3]|uniref:helix-turn-helix domain-containing protein n=1 Tax=Parapedobacter sp. 2B3 TaxID=3342381 RepID=UPI0035B61979
MENNAYLSYPHKGKGIADVIVPLLDLLVELLKRLLAGLGNPAQRHGLLYPEEVMEMLRITDRTLRRYNDQGTLCPLRIGGKSYYLMADIIEAGRGGSPS